MPKPSSAGSMESEAVRLSKAAGNLKQLSEALHHCTACNLYKHATQAVMGEGPASARVVLVGEQPGNREDLMGKPFVGPAGRLLDRALMDADIDRSDVFVTNAVKHFKFEPRGKRRIHKKPAAPEIEACQPWLVAELTLVKPEVIVCLGATAARAVIGKQHALLRERGKFFDHPMAKAVTATVHPSAILRSPDSEQRERDYTAFVKDLQAVRRRLARTQSSAG